MRSAFRSRPRARWRAALVLAGGTAAGITVAACGDKNPTGPGSSPGVHAVAGAGATDTISAEPVQSLVVEVRNESGGLATGTLVRFEAIPVVPGQMYGAYTAYVARLDESQFNIIAIDTTDGRGRASARIKMGLLAGQAKVRVVVPELGDVDTVTFTVTPGADAGVKAAHKDTALYRNHSFALRGGVVDRAGNPRNDAVTYELVPGGGIALSGGTVTAQAEGRGAVLVKAMGIVDTAYVSVVPEGVIAAGSPQGGVVMFNTDGSGFKRLAPTTLSVWTTDWSPLGTEVVFDSPNGGPVRVADLAGNVRTASSTPGSGMELYPEFSPDGSMIYFSREGWSLRRVRRDGSGDEAVPSSMPSSDVAPSLSPDGTRLVYVVSGGGGYDFLRLLTVATGDVNAIQVPGHSPAWSPRGDLIAFLDPQTYALKVMNTDGSGVRQVSAAGQSYGFGIDWSADGKWIVARNNQKNAIELLDPVAGTSLVLGYTTGMTGPSWRP